MSLLQVSLPKPCMRCSPPHNRIAYLILIDFVTPIILEEQYKARKSLLRTFYSPLLLHFRYAQKNSSALYSETLLAYVLFLTWKTKFPLAYNKRQNYNSLSFSFNCY